MSGYLRLFSFLSLLAVIIMAVSAGISLRHISEDDLTKLAERNNSSLAKGYINTVWKEYRNTVLPLTNDPAKLVSNPAVMEFAEKTVRYFHSMPLIHANIYDPNGALLLTVNTRAADKSLGSIHAPPPVIIYAQVIKPNQTVNKILEDVTLANINSATLVQTLVPIRFEEAGAPPGNAEGAIELLSDITDSSEEIFHVQLFCTAGIIIGFLVFLCILLIVSHKTELIITKQHEANLELAEAATTAKAENLEKSQFLANVSHELRTPLNAIIGFSEMLKNEAKESIHEQKHHDYIGDIHSSGVHLLSLINDILDYSKAEAGKLELDISEVNAHKMVQNCMRLVGPRAESGQVRLIEDLPKEQLTMITDGKKFKQILLNLLSNAVKFTPPGGEVHVTGWSNVSDSSFTFEVRDTGIGIAPKDISRAMSPFGQVDNTLKRKYEGTGLGLPLTKKFVELMGGKFTIESQLNVGTKITFTLPREIMPRDGLIIKTA